MPATTATRALPSLVQIDQDAAVRDAVDKLILDEMATFEPPDYLADMPVVVGTHLLPGAAAEMERIGRGEPAAPRLSATATFTTVAPPTGAAASDVEAWERSVARAQVAVEAQTLRSINVELMGKYGVEAWKAHCEGLDRLLAVSKSRVTALQAKSQQLNAARKGKQDPAGARLKALQRKWEETMDSNLHVELACADAAREVARLKALAAATGLTGDA